MCSHYTPSSFSINLMHMGSTSSSELSLTRTFDNCTGRAPSQGRRQPSLGIVIRFFVDLGFWPPFHVNAEFGYMVEIYIGMGSDITAHARRLLRWHATRVRRRTSLIGSCTVLDESYRMSITNFALLKANYAARTSCVRCTARGE